MADRLKPLAGALELLSDIRSLGMRTVIASNTYWRDAESYWDDFRQLGMADHVNAIVTSVDAGHLKPHPAVFELAMRAGGAPAERCVVIGNKEENDIEPALALGMRAILVYPDDPAPTSSKADAVAPDGWSCRSGLKAMLARRGAGMSREVERLVIALDVNGEHVQLLLPVHKTLLQSA